MIQAHKLFDQVHLSVDLQRMINICIFYHHKDPLVQGTSIHLSHHKDLKYFNVSLKLRYVKAAGGNAKFYVISRCIISNKTWILMITFVSLFTV